MRLSIITINYNNLTGLQKTILSVLSQTYNDYEWIVIDGGSNDGSVDFLNSYSKHFKFWCSEHDGGIYQAMNKGILHSQGDYCFFLNSGDYFFNENVLETLFKNEFGEDFIQCNLIISLNSKVIGKSKGKAEITFLDIFSGMIKHQATFIKRKLFQVYGFYDDNLRILSDLDFFLKTLGIGEASYKYIDLDVAFFDNNGISNKCSQLVTVERDLVIKRYLSLRMQPDYVLLQKFDKYKMVTENKVSFFILKILNRMLKSQAKN